MTFLKRQNSLLFIMTILGMAAFWQSPVGAQNLADNMAGFGASSDEPIAIEADKLEVLDNQQEAIFSGNVIVRQGETTLQTAQLVITYQDDRDNGTQSQSSGGLSGVAGARQIKKLDASGKVLITSGEQTASGERATMEMDKELITMEGDVVLSQGGNVIKGERLVINLKTRESRMVAGGGNGRQGGRVQGLFLPGSVPQN
jgi:lipopolysaccharide export system protein LptA